MADKKDSSGWTDAEKEAMKARNDELKAEKKGGKAADRAAENLAIQLEKIAEMGEPDRSMAKRIHDLVLDAAPMLEAKTWYGMPAWARDGKTVAFFQGAEKFKSRYATFGLSDLAMVDEGDMWPTSFAVTELTPEVEKRIVELITRAVS